jgi:hypothetical protein
MAIKQKNTAEVRDLRPKDLLGLKGHGNEPKPVDCSTEQKRLSYMGKAFNWYNYFCSNKEAKQFICDYLTATGEIATAKKVNRTPDSKIAPTFGFLARMSMRGLELSENEKVRLNNEIARLVNMDDDNPETEETIAAAAVVEETNKKNIQIVMRERASDVSGELQGLLDEYISAGCKTGIDPTTKVVNYLSEKNILPQHTSIVTQPFDPIKDELVEVQQGTDEQLVEGYSHLSKTQIKNIIKYIDTITSAVNSYVALKQTNKVKRAKKPVSVEKQVSKLKYLRKFVDEKAKLNLVSIEPTKLHNSSECWVYDTAKRKLYHFVADELGKCLIVKGNTLLGFDTKESEAKILRKPEEQLKQIMGSKPAARKFFKEIKAVATTPNGRFNAAMIILKAF